MSWMRQKSELENNATPTPPTSPVASPSKRAPAAEPSSPRSSSSTMSTSSKPVTVGKSIEFKGELTGHEDLVLEGRVEGQIRLPNHKLTIGANARIKAEVSAKTVHVLGEVHGNIVAEDVVQIASSGSVHGDVTAPRVAIADGARFKGQVDMQGSGSSSRSQASQAQPSRDEMVAARV